MKNKIQVQESDAKKLRVGLFQSTTCFIFCIFFLSSGIDARADVFEGAVVGGFLGLVLGDDIDDVAAGAVVGAGVGAASGSKKKKEAEKRAQQQRAQEQKQLQQQTATAQKAASDQQAQEQALIRAVGEDNYRGLLALVDCEHKRAEALAGAGGASSNPDHKLASLWLKALIANDLRQKDRTAKLYQQIVSADADIDTKQQASLETDKVLMDVRQERRDRGISCRF